MKKIKITELLIFVVSAELAGAFSALISGNKFSEYNELIQPPLAPPGWIFPVVWGILYALMGISAYIIHISDNNYIKKRNALIIYTAQLLVNFMWSIVFFGLGLLGTSVFVILLLLLLITVMAVVFYRIRPLAAFLNIPYIIWVLFASYLNIAIWILNH